MAVFNISYQRVVPPSRENVLQCQKVNKLIFNCPDLSNDMIKRLTFLAHGREEQVQVQLLLFRNLDNFVHPTMPQFTRVNEHLAADSDGIPLMK